MFRRSGERGQATVELALSLPLVAMLLGALVEVGLVATDQTRLWHAAHEAARVAIVEPDERFALAAAQRGGLVPLEMEIDPDTHARRAGRPLTVSLTYRTRSRIPILGSLLPSVELQANATMRIERP
ncbi:MAG: pilus assembly protein [Actinomycetota bacterium]|nr:pilus assembly protein [Actinomycetota bacterium]